MHRGRSCTALRPVLVLLLCPAHCVPALTGSLTTVQQPPCLRADTYTTEQNTLYSFGLGWAKFALTNNSACIAECA